MRVCVRKPSLLVHFQATHVLAVTSEAFGNLGKPERKYSASLGTQERGVERGQNSAKREKGREGRRGKEACKCEPWGRFM